MSKTQMKSSIFLLLAATIWGFAFSAQSISADSIGSFTLNSTRSLIGALALVPFVLFRYRKAKKSPDYKKPDKNKVKTTLLGGLCCGLCFFVATNIQQFGISADTPAGKAGFITALYIVLVPILGLFLRKKITILTGFSVLLAILGLYLLCINDGLNIQTGDILILICAFCFSIHILVIDHFTQKADGVLLGILQLFIAGILGLFPMFFLEKPSITPLLDAWLPILYLGIMSSGVAYTLQILGQKNMNPTAASLILSLESVMSVIGGCLLLGETLSGREIAGCIIMFAAIILSQLPPLPKYAKKQT